MSAEGEIEYLREELDDEIIDHRNALEAVAIVLARRRMTMLTDEWVNLVDELCDQLESANPGGFDAKEFKRACFEQVREVGA